MVFVAALDRPSRSAFDAAVAAVADVTLVGDAACDRALPAADLEVAPVALPPSMRTWQGEFSGDRPLRASGRHDGSAHPSFQDGG
jgi:hypothetical protein